MSREYTKNGWIDTIKKETKIDFARSAYFKKPIYSVESLIAYTKKHKRMNNGGRNHCQRCRKRWTTIKTGNVWLAMVKGQKNKSLCDKCKDEVVKNNPIYKLP